VELWKVAEQGKAGSMVGGCFPRLVWVALLFASWDESQEVSTLASSAISSDMTRTQELSWPE